MIVFELFMVEISKELFRHLRFEALRILIQPNEENGYMFQTRSLKKNLFASTYIRTVTKK